MTIGVLFGLGLGLVFGGSAYRPIERRQRADDECSARCAPWDGMVLPDANDRCVCIIEPWK